jgi:hypothetical protein
MAKTKAEIEEGAKLAVDAMQGKDVCPYPEGTAAYVVWMEAYGLAEKEFYDNVDVSYDMHPEHWRK